jgi:hypothetical protein
MSGVFVSTGDAARIIRSKPIQQRKLQVAAHVFKANPWQIQNLCTMALLPHVCVYRNRLIAVTYVESYAEFLRSNRFDLTVKNARLFASTNEAQQLSREAEARFNSQIESRDVFSISEVASLLCVGYETIRKWIRKGALRADKQIAVHRQPYTISPEAIREVCEWRYVHLKR